MTDDYKALVERLRMDFWLLSAAEIKTDRAKAADAIETLVAEKAFWRERQSTTRR